MDFPNTKSITLGAIENSAGESETKIESHKSAIDCLKDRSNNGADCLESDCELGKLTLLMKSGFSISKRRNATEK